MNRVERSFRSRKVHLQIHTVSHNQKGDRAFAGQVRCSDYEG